MKTTFRFTALLLTLALAAFAATAATIEKMPFSASQLEQGIGQELVLLPGYTVFDNIGFEVKGATVRLTGEVTQETLKQAAEQAVKEVPGVRQVVNNIEVLPSSSLDNQIRLAAFRAIYSEPALRSYASQSVQPIHIIVKNGCLTLEGSVASDTDRKLTYSKVLSVPGVVAVSNRLQTAS